MTKKLKTTAWALKSLNGFLYPELYDTKQEAQFKKDNGTLRKGYFRIIKVKIEKL